MTAKPIVYVPGQNRDIDETVQRAKDLFGDKLDPLVTPPDAPQEEIDPATGKPPPQGAKMAQQVLSFIRLWASEGKNPADLLFATHLIWLNVFNNKHIQELVPAAQRESIKTAARDYYVDGLKRGE